MASIQEIFPCLWFDTQAEEAANFYISVFKNGRILQTVRYGKEGFEAHNKPEGSVMTVDFEINGKRFMALNGGPVFQFNEAVSFVINCDTQEEIDYYWEKLGDGGDPRAQVCGWLKDKYGLSWQVAPVAMEKMFSDQPTPASERVMAAMMKMKKLDMAELQRAYEER